MFVDLKLTFVSFVYLAFVKNRNVMHTYVIPTEEKGSFLWANMHVTELQKFWFICHM